MTTLTDLWLPLLLSGIAVFILSSIFNTIWWHKHEFPAPPRQEDLLAALRPFNLAPGEYSAPRAASAAEMKDPAYQEKLRQGPVILLTVRPNGPYTMRRELISWFIYCLVVGGVAACVDSTLLPPGSAYRTVFHTVGLVAFAGYSLALWQAQIWFGRDLVATIKSTIDGLIYALVTAGIFGAMWPS